MYQDCPNAATWTEGWNRVFRDAGFSIRAWGVKDETLMHRMLAMKVDGMTVNFPDKLQKALKEL
jgi:glycerophosphoryl diester phosphodiesterase